MQERKEGRDMQEGRDRQEGRKGRGKGGKGERGSERRKDVPRKEGKIYLGGKQGISRKEGKKEGRK